MKWSLRMGSGVLNLRWPMQGLGWPIHPSKTSLKVGINSPTLLFVYDNFNIKKTW